MDYLASLTKGIVFSISQVWELEQKLRARDNTPSKHVEFMPEYELEEKVRNHDERLVGMMMAHDVENQKSCKCVACDNSNSPYPIPRSPNHGKKIRIPPSFSSYACHRRSYVDNDIESSFRYVLMTSISIPLV